MKIINIIISAVVGLILAVEIAVKLGISNWSNGFSSMALLILWIISSIGIYLFLFNSKK